MKMRGKNDRGSDLYVLTITKAPEGFDTDTQDDNIQMASALYLDRPHLLLTAIISALTPWIDDQTTIEIGDESHTMGEIAGRRFDPGYSRRIGNGWDD